MIINSDLPFILLPDIILLGKVDKICDRFGRKKRKSVYNVNLRATITLVFQSFEKRERRQERDQIEEYLNGMLGRYSRLDELGLFEQHALCHLKAMNVREREATRRESQATCLFVSPIAFPNILLIVAQTLEYFLDGGLRTS
jgi:hypothetical protein